MKIALNRVNNIIFSYISPVIYITYIWMIGKVVWRSYDNISVTLSVYRYLLSTILLNKGISDYNVSGL